MVQPINYGGAFAPQRPVNLFENVMQVRALQDRQRMQQDAANREAMFQADYQAAMESGLTPQKLIGLDAKHPGSLKNFKDILGQVQEDQRQGYIQNIVPVHNLLQKGDVKNARMLADRTRDAYRNSGDEQKAQQWAFFGEQIDAGQGLGISSGMLAAAGPDAVESYEVLEAAPIKIEKSKLDIKKLESEVAQMAKGGLSNEERNNIASKLRGEYSKETKVFRDIDDSYNRINAAQDTAAGDLSLIFQYMKLLDPGSTVREGEFANAQNAGSISDKVYNVYNRILTGERLTPKQRKEFKDQAKKNWEAAKTRERVVRNGIKRIGAKQGIPEEDLFYEDPEASPVTTQAEPQTATQGDQPTDVVAGEKIFKFKTQEEAEKFKAEARARGLLK